MPSLLTDLLQALALPAMPEKFLQRALDDPENELEIEEAAPLGGTRAQAIQRLQIGMIGTVAMIFVVGLADVVLEHSRRAEEVAEPQLSETALPEPEPTQQSDPLTESGVVPDVPADPEPDQELVEQAEEAVQGGGPQ